MLSHTRNRQSRWIKVIEAFEFEAATAPMAKAKPNSVSDRRYVADEKWHVKRDKSLIRNANWTNKTMYSISIVTYNGIRVAKPKRMRSRTRSLSLRLTQTVGM